MFASDNRKLIDAVTSVPCNDPKPKDDRALGPNWIAERVAVRNNFFLHDNSTKVHNLVA